jgi:hypothetical protein
VFFGGFWVILIGLVLWGIGFATQDTLLKALVVGVLPEGRLVATVDQVNQ